MRIIVNFTENKEPVPYNNMGFINSYINKCLGRNNPYHNISGEYNISGLIGGDSGDAGWNFKSGGKIIITSKDESFLNKLLSGFMDNKKFFWGMEYKNVDFIVETFYSGLNHFYTLSPILLKKNLSYKKYDFHTLNDSDFDEILTIRTLNKLKAIDTKQNLKLDLTNFKITTKNINVPKIMVKNVVNKSNRCIASIICNKKVAELLYNVGLGQSTNSGFGCICKVENRKSYNMETE